MPSTAPQNGYYHQAPPGAPYQMPPPPYHSGPRPVDYSGPRPVDYSGPIPVDYSRQRPADYSGPRPVDYRETAPVPTDAPDAGITLNSKPDIRDLAYLEKNNEKLQLIVRVAARWESLALHLGIESYVISIISRDKSKCEDACIDMFQRWLGGEGCGPRTWAGIVSALEKMEENMIVHLVRELLQEQ